MAQQPFEQALKDEGLVGTPLESLARSIYMQESGGGKNTQTSNAGAVGGMQILPGTFKEVMPQGDINNPYDNARAGLRYIKKMYDVSGGDLNLTAVGYYGGPGGIAKAKEGVAVKDPRNPNAPDTLQYAQQVLSRTDVPRGTKPPKIIRKNIENLGTGYQAAFALMASADEEPETEREREAREEREETESAQQFASIRKQLTSTQGLRSPIVREEQQEPVQMANGGLAGVPIYQVPTYRASDKQWFEDVEAQQKAYKSSYDQYKTAYDDYYKNVYTPYASQVDEYNKAVETYNAGPRTAEFTTKAPTAPNAFTMQAPTAPAMTQAEYDARAAQARERAKRDAQSRATAIQAVQNPDQFNLAGFGKAGLAGTSMYAQGGLVDQPLEGAPFQPTVPGNLNNSVVMMNEGGEATAPAQQGSSGGFERWLATKMGLDKAWDKSLDAPAEMGLSEDSGTRGDAVRHMTLMREIEKKYNPTVAKALGYAHEFIGGPMQYLRTGEPQSSRDREMDIRNNALGLELSKQAGGDDAKFRELMRQALEQKQADFYREEYMGKNKTPGMTRVRQRAEGSPEEGEVKGKAFESPQTAKQMLKDIGRGVSYYPYDLIGAPVDVINLGLKGVDYLTGSKLATEKPVGGSEYLIEKSRRAGIAEKPTGSAAEELARFGSAFVNPAAGARATGRVLGKAGQLGMDVLEDLSMATTGQGGSKMAQMVTSQAQPMFAVRPKGGVYLGAQSAKEQPLSRPDYDLREAIENIDQSTEQGKAIADFLDKKVRKYVQTQQGTPDDPMFKALLQGRIEPRYMGEPEMWQRARAGDPAALEEARRRYDASLGMTNIIPQATAKERGKGYEYVFTREQEKALREKIKQQAPNEPVVMADVRPVSKRSMEEFANLYDYPGIDQIIKETESGKLLRLLNKTDLPQHIRQAAVEGEPIAYQYSGVSGFNLPLQITEIKDYLNTRTPAEIKNMGVTDVVVKAKEWHRTMEEARKDPSKFSKKQLMEGTEKVLPTSNDMQWVNVKDSDALSLEGNIMGHCVGGSNYCNAVNQGKTKIISLRDKKGFPHVTIELTANDKGVFDRVAQIKGTANNSPSKYFDQVDEFLTDYQSKLGDTPLRITESPSYVPEKWRK